MAKNRKINLLTVSYKTALYRVVRIVSNLILFGLLLGNWTKAITYNIWLTALATVQYFLFDYFFSKKISSVISNEGAIVWIVSSKYEDNALLSYKLNGLLSSQGYNVQCLNNYELRAGLLSDDLGISKQEDKITLNRLAFIANILSKNKIITILSVVKPSKYKACSDSQLVEIYINNMYVDNCDDNCDMITVPDITLKFSEMNINDSANRIIEELKFNKIIG